MKAQVVLPLIVFFCLLFMERVHPLRIQRDLIFFRLVKNIILALAALPFTRLLTLPILLALGETTKRHETSPVIFLVGLISFDYMMYWWHVGLHKIKFLWRFHQVHHSDLDMDTSTALRFHFGELVFSLVPRALFLVVTGVDVKVLLSIDIITTIMVFFHHSNLRLPLFWEKKLGPVIVTPLYHQEHHSQFLDETDSNFSTLFSFWDRLHQTHSPVRPPEEIKIGLPYFKRSDVFLWDLFTMPSKKPKQWPKEFLKRPDY